MSERQSEHDLKVSLLSVPVYPERRYRHRKTGKVVTVDSVALIESDLSLAVVYWERTEVSGVLTWVRPAAEFLERFEVL